MWGKYSSSSSSKRIAGRLRLEKRVDEGLVNLWIVKKYEMTVKNDGAALSSSRASTGCCCLHINVKNRSDL